MAMNGAAAVSGPDLGLDKSWVVEASAGTGKTTALVARIVEVIAAGTPVETIVAVTFTHAAAGNMKLRVRHELEQRRAGELDPVVKARLGEAARSLDRAFIGTIHAFCAQLLRRRPVEAGGDPVFQELAQPGALRVFSRVFQRWVEQRLTSPSPVLLHAFARPSWREEAVGAISTRPGTSAPSTAAPLWRRCCRRRRARWICAIAAPGPTISCTRTCV